MGVTLLILLVGLAGASQAPDIEQQHRYPKRSNDDAALLEWGSSAIIHNADGVVAQFGPSAAHPEFELGIEALIVTANPRQGCGPLTNAAAVGTQIVVMVRGGCDFAQKARTALAAGAAALIVVNSDRRSPDRAFAMDGDELPADFSLPSVMISYAAGQQLREHSPSRMRVFAGGGRPFIESVADAQPVLYLVHNAITDVEVAAARQQLEPYLVAAETDGAPTMWRAHRSLGVLRGHDLNQFYERISSIVGYPVDHLSELVLERRLAGAPYALRDDRRLSPFGARGRDDARAQPVMSVYVYLDDVAEDAGGALHFPRALPAAVRIQPTRGLAAVFYSALEDGSLDRSAAHGDAASTGNDVWVLKLRVYADARPLIRRALLPLALLPWRGAPSEAASQAVADFFVRRFGPQRCDAAADAALAALAALALLPLLLVGLFVASKVEQARAPPKRKTAVPENASKKKN
ncbi:hypothetical protein M885DRAFT_550789 [Pelagophyceae sp. CCMP2097]|nr:hypothetical protein M885DRAFT_550789 [Pelagophyceae sp. CCMP2097]|mmetsp:Transcript_3536/g.10729  ORF Transcript_3536/g.10729 Transcript_3536/m.10729 type:complete len:464 (+) Transcript_3536:31-1422(+)